MGIGITDWIFIEKNFFYPLLIRNINQSISLKKKKLKIFCLSMPLIFVWIF